MGSLVTSCQDYKELKEIPDDPDINVDEDRKNADTPIYDEDNEEDDICVNDFNEGYAELRAPVCEPEVMDNLDMDDDMDDCTEEYGRTKGYTKMQAPLCEQEVEDLDDLDDCNCTKVDIEEQIKITMEEIEQLMLEHREGVDE